MTRKEAKKMTLDLSLSVSRKRKEKEIEYAYMRRYWTKCELSAGEDDIKAYLKKGRDTLDLAELLIPFKILMVIAVENEVLKET